MKTQPRGPRKPPAPSQAAKAQKSGYADAVVTVKPVPGPGNQWRSVYRHNALFFADPPTDKDLAVFGDDGWQLTGICAIADGFHAVFTRHEWVAPTRPEEKSP